MTTAGSQHAAPLAREGGPHRRLHQSAGGLARLRGAGGPGSRWIKGCGRTLDRKSEARAAYGLAWAAGAAPFCLAAASG